MMNIYSKIIIKNLGTKKRIGQPSQVPSFFGSLVLSLNKICYYLVNFEKKKNKGMNSLPK